jgi:hypothetical protein
MSQESYDKIMADENEETGMSESELEGKQQQDCENGMHRFIPCNDHDPTCLNCGKFQ